DVLAAARVGVARAVSVGGVVSLVLGAFLMKKTIAVVVAVALVALLCWSAGFLDAPVDAPSGVGGTAVAAIAGDSSVSESPAGEREAVAVGPVVTPPAGLVFRGRCVAAATGEPIAGVTAGVWTWDPLGDGLDRALSEAEIAVAVDAGGEFELRCPVVPRRELLLRLSRADLVERQRQFGPYEAPTVVDLGDIAMRAGSIVRTWLVDQRGEPVAGVRTLLSREVVPGRNDMLLERVGHLAYSAADGSLDWGVPIAPGRYRVIWGWNGLPDDCLMGRMIVPDRASFENTLVWPVEDDRQTIRGVVTDMDGRPVPRLRLGAAGGGTRGNAQTRPDGAFVMARIGPYDDSEQGPVTFGLPWAIQGYALIGEPTCRWGDSDVRLVAAPGAGLTVRVTDARTDRAVDEFAVASAALLSGSENEPTFGFPHEERLDDGSLRLDLPSAPHLLQVIPRDPALEPSELIRWQPGSTDALEVQLAESASCVVRVVDGAGRPVVGTEVWSLRPIEAIAATGRGSSPNWVDVAMPDRRALSLSPRSRWANCGIDDAPLEHATTDAGGRVTLHVPSAAGVVLAAFGPGHVPRAIASKASPADADEVELRVVRGAALRLDISPLEIAGRLVEPPRQGAIAAARSGIPGSGGAELWIARVAHEQDAERLQALVKLPIAGRVSRREGMPPGTYDLTLAGNIATGELDGIMVYQPLARIELRDGEETVVPVDLGNWTTGRIAGQVLVNGSSWSHGVASLRAPLRGERSHCSVQVALDGDGRFDVEVLPGDYRLQLIYRERAGNVGYWFAAETYPVVSGATTNAVFDVRRVRANVRIVTAAGEPARGLQVTVDCSSAPRGWQTWTTDADGCFELDPAPLDRFALVVATPSRTGTLADGLPGAPRDALLGPLQVPPTGTTAEFRVELPAGWR
ncbi:MAG: carboxypeptidase regulatory-like domain-containing protein, partial [Planctomycetes bacterium]|nr:carboxypeptidase regulatory-like domain-containing protein [Planctomycetota bacterium]